MRLGEGESVETGRQPLTLPACLDAARMQTPPPPPKLRVCVEEDSQLLPHHREADRFKRRLELQLPLLVKFL